MELPGDLDKKVAELSPAKRALLERLRGKSAEPPPITARPPGSTIPLSFAQQRLWLIHQLDPASYLYNVPRAVRMRGKLNLAALGEALNEIVRRHEILRTIFSSNGDGPVQEILPSLRIALPRSDISNLRGEALEHEVQRQAVEETRRPFDLSTGPLLRARVLRLSPNDHVLVLAMHHIASDGWTAGLLFEELAALYQAFTKAQASPLAPLPIQYADYAIWQRQRMEGETLEKELSYWRDQMSGAPPSLKLPTDSERLDTFTYRGATRSIVLPKTLSQSTVRVGQNESVTLFTTLLTALKILLFRWSGQGDLVVGTVSANRNRTEVERLIGCFMNFLPLRDHVAGSASARELLAQVNKTALGAFAHQDCPFEKIIEALNPQRALNVNPLYNVALLMQNFPELAFSTESLEARFLNVDTEVAFLDLRFIAAETGEGIQVGCEYNVDLFDAGTIDQLLSSYQSVLEQLVANPEKAIGQFSITAELEGQAQAVRKREQKKTIAVAASFTAEPVEESLAFWMRQLGIRARIEFAAYNQVFQELLDPASLLGRNSDGFNVVLLRIEDWIRFEQNCEIAASREKVERAVRELIDALKNSAGRSAVPYLLCICPASAEVLANAAWVAICQQAEETLESQLTNVPGVHIICSATLLDLYPVANYSDEYADRIGHIPYTSEFFAALGSMIARRASGIGMAPLKVIALDCDNTLWRGVCGEDGPNGVEVDAPHGALQDFMIAQQRAGMLLCLCSKNVEEDVTAVFEQNPGMRLKAKDIVASRVNWRAKSENLKEIARELGLGLDSFVLIDDNPLECAEVQANCPAVLTLQLPEEAERIPQFLKHVWALDHWKVTEEDRRRAATYQQNAEREQLRKTAGALEDFLAGLALEVDIRPMQPHELARVAQLTERTNQFNFTTIRRSEAEIQKLCDAGWQCLVVYLKDRFGDYGLVGVLLFSESNNAIELDTMLLSCRALGRKVEHRMLAALGTRARQNRIGCVDVRFVPTAKNQPALDFLDAIGFQFKTTEKNGSLYRFPAEYAAGSESLSSAKSGAAAVQEKTAKTTPQQPQRKAYARIASGLNSVPAIVHAMQSQKGLARGEGTAFVPARNATEEIVAGIWASLLRADRIGIHDNFFALGGHSLLGTQVVARLRQALNVELPLRAMFEAPTVAQLSRRVEFARRSTGTPVLPPLLPVSRKEPLPLSFAQQRLWFLDQLEPGNALYNLPQMIRVSGTLDQKALQRSLSEIVQRHEALRTTFGGSGGAPLQIILPDPKIRLEVTDLRGTPGRQTDAERLAKQEARRPFNLQTGPLVRAHLWQFEDDAYLLLLNMHHVVSDRWSMGVLAEELATFYGAFAEGKPSPLATLPVQYADYAAWQRSWLGGETLERSLDYWRARLSGAPPVLELPTDRPRPSVQTYRGASQTHLLPRELVEKLVRLSQVEGATLFMTLLAAFQVLLARYSRQDDIVVGSPIANRTQTEVEPLIGFFVNTLALRCDLSGNPTFVELLQRVKDVALGAYAHQDIPFEKLVEELQPDRSLSHNPIFQVLFALQNAPVQAMGLPGLRLERVPFYTATSMFDMSWFAIEMPEGLLLRAEYNTDLFDDTTITRALAHFHTMLEGIAAHPDQAIRKLPLLEESERHQLLVEFNSTAREYPTNVSLHQFFERQVERTPDATALIFEDHHLTYRELNGRANQLAHRLRTLGIGPDDLVGVCAHRSLEMVVALYGVLKSGGAYVPLDPDYPQDRLAGMVEDAHCKVLLMQERLLSTLPSYSGHVIALDHDWLQIANESKENLPVVTKGKNLAYAIYTSGSTGKPKGVPNVHEAIVNRLLWMQDEYGLAEGDRVLQKTPYSFDVSVWEFFWPLMAGACLVVAKPDGHKDPAYLAKIIQQRQITALHFVPSMLQIFLETEEVDNCRSLRRVFCSGEALPYEVQQRFFKLLRAELHNLYGPTEAAVDVTYWWCRADYSRTLVPIGKPVANTQIYLLDQHLEPVPMGVVGELHIGGVQLARGYLNRPELTAEKFIRDPFSIKAGARLYKTGDLARYLPDGNIEYLGRVDHQVKIRGFRIELGEIEAALDRHPAVRQSVVMAREDDPGNKRLVAYLVSDGEAPKVEELREHLRTSLPEFMIPAAFVVMDSLPLSSNGKVNRHALPAPQITRSQEQDSAAPRNPIEEQIARTWAEVLRVPQIGINDDFFTVGGHSLLATQVIARIRQAFGVDVPLRAIFESPTIAGLAARVSQSHAGLEGPILPAPRDRDLSLSFAQHRLWFLDQLEPNNPLYNIPWALRIHGALNVEALQAALDAIVERHESLRTTFAEVHGQTVQRIAPALRVPLQVSELTSADQAQGLIAEEAKRPFNLANGPLVRARLLRLGSDQHILVLNIHHIVSDRWSMGVLSSELAHFYGALSQGHAPKLPPLPVQYADFAAWQRGQLEGDVYQRQLAYWKEQLQDVPPVLELPTDRPRLAVESFRGATATVTLPAGLSTKLRDLSHEQGATLFMTLLAGFQLLLSRYSGQDDVAVGAPIANRVRPEFEGLIGFFANTLPFRGRLAGQPNFSELLARVKETALGAYSHQDMPFEKLVEELRPERSLSHNPLVQVFFALQNAPMEGLELTGLRLEPIETDTKTAKGDLYFSLVETPEGLRGRMEYNTDLFDEATIERMLAHYQGLLEAAVADPLCPVSELPLLTQEEHRQILVDWNATEFDYPRDLCLHEVFEQQVERTPNAVACVAAGGSLSYAELNQRANQLAHFLKARGVGPGQRVGLFVERSLMMMVGLLGIQKSGAAYVPLDPSYPAERLRLTLDDAQVPVLVTQQSLSSSMPKHATEVVYLDSDWAKIAAQPMSNPASGAMPEDLVYVIFTSGSTGRPKGVEVPHRAVVNLLTFMGKELEMGAEDVFPALASFAFDMSIPELYLALVTGGRVIVGERHLAANGEALAEVLRATGATVVHATPTTWNLLLGAGFTGQGLKRVIGAEALPRELSTRLLTADPSLYNFYGPTETTVWSAFHHFRSPEEPVVVGRPLANTRIYILDGHGQAVPVGVPGEIHIAGEGVSCGYLNRPELTAEKFIPDPFAAQPDAKMYRTGDLGRFLPDGRIEFQGRVDNQVKVRGYRIELGEIETVLGQHPGVQECVVMAREDVPGDKRLVGYVVAAGGERAEAAELRAWVKQRLPEYMTPVAFVTLERFPLSPNGKVDRKQLPAPEYVRPELSRAYQGARTPAEEVIAGIWAEVLKLDQVGMEDDFFELGGHSLLATQVVSRIRQAFRVELPLRAMFEAPTVAGLAERTEALARSDEGLEAPPITRVARDRALPLSFAQQRLWFLDQLEPENPLYNVPHIVRLTGGLNAAVLEQALKEIVRRHETLRTRFESVDDQPVQVIAPELRVPLEIIDLTSLPEGEREAEARRLAMEEVKRPFHLATGPLVRALLIKIADNDHALVVNTHHIISDRWSLGVLSQELAALYEAYAAGQPSPLPELGIQYADYAVWQRQYLAGGTLDRQLEYWKQQLAGAPPTLDLPTDRPRQALENFWGGVHKQALSPRLARELRILSRRHSVTFFMTLLAAFQVFLARWSGQDDVVVGTDLANRTRVETEKLIGFFVNLLPVRLRLVADSDFIEVLKQVREAALGAFAHQDLPFDKLVEELRPERKLTHNPLVQVLFVMQNTPQAYQEFGGLKLCPMGVSSTSRFDLVLFINDPDGSPNATWMYNPNLFDETTVKRAAALFEVLLVQVATAPAVKVESLFEVLSESEKQLRQGESKQFEQISLRKLKEIRRKAVTGLD